MDTTQTTKTSESPESPESIDILIVGAGIIGSAVAMHLAELGGPELARRIRVIDFDLEGSLSSSELNAGGIRATWNQPVNIRMSRLTIDYLAGIADEVGYNGCGYLWLHGPGKLELALKSRDRQLEAGWPVEAWDVAQLKRRVPWIDKTGDLAGAIFAPRDGLVNPNRVKCHFRERARALGVGFDDRTLLVSSELESSSESGFRLVAKRFPPMLSDEIRQSVLCGLEEAQSSEVSLIRYRASRVVNCAGPWAARVARVLGYHCPSVAVRRQISLFDCRELDLSREGMMVDPSGVYFHPEATHLLAGFANHGEPPGFNFTYDGENFFNEMIWTSLYERSSHFEKLRHLTGWAGLYEVSPDESAILGPVVARKVDKERAMGRLYEAHSFSGHGVMHSYAAGLALAELMLRGGFVTLDATELSAARFESGRAVRESMVI